MDLVQYARQAGSGMILEDRPDDETFDLEPDAVQAYMESELG